MAEKETQGFFFDRMRSSLDGQKNIVVQGYAIDGYLDGVRPRAAVFIGKKPVKNLKCRLEAVKLPPIQMRRRKGDTISYLGIFFIDLSEVSKMYGSGAKLVVIAEKNDDAGDGKKRELIYKCPLDKAIDRMYTYFYSVDVAYAEEGKTYIRGWLAGSQATVIKAVDADKKAENTDTMNYKIEFIPRDDVLIEYPECPDDACLGFEMSVDGEYKKLGLEMREGERTLKRVITIGKNDDEFSKSNIVSRYSEKIVRNLQNYGVAETMSKVKIHLSPSYVNLNRNYNKWIKKNSPDAEELKEQRKKEKAFVYRPLLSVLVPLYETDEKFLDELIVSIQAQTYTNWEICFSDGSKSSDRLREIISKYTKKDKRIKYTAELPGPLGISSNTNQAFTIAKGEFIVLGDHDDLFTPDAFFDCVEALQTGINEIDVIYTDEDKTNAAAKRRFEPNIKPDFNQELLESCNYITHMFVVRKSLVEEVGLFDDTYNGAQDYDFILRCTEKARVIHHVPKVVYSWRINDTSTAGNPAAKMYAYDAGAKALQAHYDRIGSSARAEIGDHLGYYHTVYDIKCSSDDITSPILYVIVVDADEDEKYDRTFKSIDEKSDFKNIEYIRVKSEGDPNLARQLTKGVEKVKNSEKVKGYKDEDIYIAFIEAGVTMMGEDGLSNMLAYLSNRTDVGAVGGKIYCTDGTICHGGVVLEKEKVVGWMYIRHSIYDEMYFNYSAYSALRRGVTMMRLSDIIENGSWSDDYTGEFAMIDFTNRMIERGKKSIYDANANFQVRVPRGYDADEVFERKGLTRKDLRIFRSKRPDVYECGDKYFTNIIKDIKEKEMS